MLTRRLFAVLLVLTLAAAACSLPTASERPTDEENTSPTAVITFDQDEPALLITVTPIPPIASPLGTTIPTISLDQLKNAQVKITGVDGVSPERTVQLSNGQFESNSDPTSSDFVNVNMGSLVAFGDLNGDGLQDAAIIIGENYGGTGVFTSVAVMLNQMGQPIFAGSVTIDDRPAINALSIQNGEILVDATIHGPNDPGCCPAQPVTKTLRLWSGKLVQTRHTSKLPDGVTERIIKIDAPADGSELSGPFTLSGSVTVSPFENTLGYKVFLEGATEPVVQSALMVNAAEMGGPGTFSVPLDLTQAGVHGKVRIEITDVSAADGSSLAVASVFVTIK